MIQNQYTKGVSSLSGECLRFLMSFRSQSKDAKFSKIAHSSSQDRRALFGFSQSLSNGLSKDREKLSVFLGVELVGAIAGACGSSKLLSTSDLP